MVAINPSTSRRMVDSKAQRIFALLCELERGKQPALTSEERGELVYLQRRISWSKARMERLASQVAVVTLPRPATPPRDARRQVG
jgi:hypothetical protein